LFKSSKDKSLAKGSKAVLDATSFQGFEALLIPSATAIPEDKNINIVKSVFFIIVYLSFHTRCTIFTRANIYKAN